MTTPAIGVLFPVRLETRFVRPAGPRGDWRLRVRVVPEAISLANHDDRASELELDAVEAMWRSADGSDLETHAGRHAFRELARAVGAERAAWLARTFPAVTGGDGGFSIERPGELRTEMRAPTLHGFPPGIEIWIARGGRPAALLASMSVLLDEVDLELDEPDRTDQPWWVSFDEAVRVGLAAEIVLGWRKPDDLDVVYAVGIGGGDPGPLLDAQSDAGRLGIAAAGESTNSVDGGHTIGLGDVDTWRRLVRVDGADQAGTSAMSTVIAGKAMPHGVVGGERDLGPVNRAMVGAMWPALWGHSLANVWGYGQDAHELGVWAGDNLVPEGPLPVLRIDQHPYGVLPATSLDRWRRADNDPAIERRLIPLVRQLIDVWAASVDDASRPDDPFERIVRTPNATQFAWRWMVPTTLAHALAFRFGQQVVARDLDRWWSDTAAPIAKLDPTAQESRRLVEVGWSHPVQLRRETDGSSADGSSADAAPGDRLRRLATTPVAELLADADAGPRSGDSWSLIAELGRHSMLSSSAAMARSLSGRPRPIVEPVAVDDRTATETEEWALRARPVDRARRGDAAVDVHNNVVDGLEHLATADVVDVDRSLRAALETATNRLDPWATGIAWRRLQDMASAPRTLGVYGWVDRPRPRRQQPDHRFSPAPSTEQASVAAILRDRAQSPTDPDRWTMLLESDAVRGALRLADMTRAGAHPGESLGRLVESIIGRTVAIDQLRERFPSTQPGIPSRYRRRRVCDGAAVLDAATTSPTPLAQLDLTGAEIEALVELSTAVDALADLHVAEAVLGVVKGRTSSVAAATSAAAGQSPPPSFDVVRTPPSGRLVNTVALAVLPDVTGALDADPGPAMIADPAVATMLDVAGGDPSSAAWRWTTHDAAGSAVGSVTLADLGMQPRDTVGLGADSLRDVVREGIGAVALGDDDPPGHAAIRRAAVALTGVPALSDDVGDDPDDGAALAELLTRYQNLRSVAADAAAQARDTSATATSSAVVRTALLRLARWGIWPVADPAVSTDDDLVTRLDRAAAVLERRIARTSATFDDPTVATVAAAVADLVSPGGSWPVFSRLTTSNFTGIREEPSGADGSDVRLDPDWLEVVGAVRPEIARLEAVQLEWRTSAAMQPFRSWSNRPGDPWQSAAPPASDTEVTRPSRLVAAFGPQSVLPQQPDAGSSATVAVAVIDRFSETVPDAEHVGAVAFSHDLPGARSPQAVVLAVPPVVDEELTGPVLVDIVAEVRRLARVRMADAQALGAAAGPLHFAAMPAAGRTGVDLGAPT